MGNQHRDDHSQFIEGVPKQRTPLHDLALQARQTHGRRLLGGGRESVGRPSRRVPLIFSRSPPIPDAGLPTFRYAPDRLEIHVQLHGQAPAGIIALRLFLALVRFVPRDQASRLSRRCV